MTLSNNQKRRMKSAARLYAVQALFQMAASGQTVDQVTRELDEHRLGATYDGGELSGRRANVAGHPAQSGDQRICRCGRGIFR